MFNNCSNDVQGVARGETVGEGGDGRSLQPAKDTVSTCARKDGYIRLDHKSFSRDSAPVVQGCSCIACANYTRAYVHHLINAHEILSEILLFCHNLHHLLNMFQQMSHALMIGKGHVFQRHIQLQF